VIYLGARPAQSPDREGGAPQGPETACAAGRGSTRACRKGLDSEPFSPGVGTTMLGSGLLIRRGGIYEFFPVGGGFPPQFDFPSIGVSARVPCGPVREAATAAAPWSGDWWRNQPDRHRSKPPQVRWARPASSCNRHRPRHRPRRGEVQAAIKKHRLADLPKRLAGRCSAFANPNTAAATVHLAMTSKTSISSRQIYDVADTSSRSASAGAGVGGSHVAVRPTAGGRIASTRSTRSNAGVATTTSVNALIKPIRSARSRIFNAPPSETRRIKADADRGGIPRHHQQEFERQLVRLSDIAESRTPSATSVDSLVQQAAGGADPDHQAGRRQRLDTVDIFCRVRALIPDLNNGSQPGWVFPSGPTHRDHPRQRRGGHAADGLATALL